MNADEIAAALGGGLDAVERLLAEDVVMVWWSGDDWECHGRDSADVGGQALIPGALVLDTDDPLAVGGGGDPFR